MDDNPGRATDAEPDQRAPDSLRYGAGAGRIAVARGGVASYARGDLPRARLAMRRHLGGRSDANAHALRRDLACPWTRARCVHRGHRDDHIRTGHRPAGTRLERSQARLDTRRHTRRQLSPSGGRRTCRAPCRLRTAHHGRGSCAGRVGVLQPRHSRALPRSAGDDDGGLQPDRAVHRAEESQRRSRPVLSALAGSVLRGLVRWLLRAGQSGLADSARPVRGGTAIEAIPGICTPGRSSAVGRGAFGAIDRRAAHRLRKPVSNEGRVVQVAAVVRRALPEAGHRLRRRSRHHRSQGGRGRTTSPCQ